MRSGIRTWFRLDPIAAYFWRIGGCISLGLVSAFSSSDSCEVVICKQILTAQCSYAVEPPNAFARTALKTSRSKGWSIAEAFAVPGSYQKSAISANEGSPTPLPPQPPPYAQTNSDTVHACTRLPHTPTMRREDISRRGLE